jgi:glycyl-tRNA synthetase beta subunit
MSEERSNYMDLEHALKTVETRLRDITTDPTASHWLKQAVTELWERDVVDALNDLDVLRDLLEAKHQADRNHDGTRH